MFDETGSLARQGGELSQKFLAGDGTPGITDPARETVDVDAGGGEPRLFHREFHRAGPNAGTAGKNDGTCETVAQVFLKISPQFFCGE